MRTNQYRAYTSHAPQAQHDDNARIHYCPPYLRKTQAAHATLKTKKQNKTRQNDDTTEKNISQKLCLCLMEHSRPKIRAISVRAQGFELSPPSPWDSSYPSNAPSDIDALSHAPQAQQDDYAKIHHCPPLPLQNSSRTRFP